uniref:ZP domain-containing protein n=1 Tax=Panagrolaimus sp. JU765 TaxID=591449 RepID=A0AC34PXC6_9BILA
VKERADVIDSRGCPVDPLLVTGVRYSDDMQRAYAESQVFKFADRPGIWFFCQVQMCMKKEGMCDGITPPACAGTSVVTSKTSFGSHLLTTDGDDEDSEVTKPPKSKKTKKLNRSQETIDEEVEDYSNEDYANKETYQSKKKKHKKVDYEGDEDDGNEKTKPKSSRQKLRINHPYSVPNPSPDYDLHAKEPV